MKRFHVFDEKASLLALACIASAIMLAMTACEGEGGGSADGTTVSGTVSSFSASGVTFFARPQPSKLQYALRSIAGVFVSTAEAAAPGVLVRIEGTGLSCVTQADGSFVIFDVPAGSQRLMFSLNDASNSMEIEVPVNAWMQFEDVRVSTSGVNVHRIHVEQMDRDRDHDQLQVHSPAR
jgi:hypothetical protein